MIGLYISVLFLSLQKLTFIYFFVVYFICSTYSMDCSVKILQHNSVTIVVIKDSKQDTIGLICNIMLVMLKFIQVLII